MRLIRAKIAVDNKKDGNEASDDSINEYKDSQESTLMEICDVEESNKMMKSDLVIV